MKRLQRKRQRSRRNQAYFLYCKRMRLRTIGFNARLRFWRAPLEPISCQWLHAELETIGFEGLEDMSHEHYA